MSEQSKPETCICCDKPGQIYDGSKGYWCNWCGFGWTFAEEDERREFEAGLKEFAKEANAVFDKAFPSTP